MNQKTLQRYIGFFLQQEPSVVIKKEFVYKKEVLPTIKLVEVNAVNKKFKDDKNPFVYVTGPEPKSGEKLTKVYDLLAIIDTKEKLDIRVFVAYMMLLKVVFI